MENGWSEQEYKLMVFLSGEGMIQGPGGTRDDRKTPVFLGQAFVEREGPRVSHHS